MKLVYVSKTMALGNLPSAVFITSQKGLQPPGHDKRGHKGLSLAEICGKSGGYRFWDMTKGVQGFVSCRNLWQKWGLSLPGHDKSRHKGLFPAEICGKSRGYDVRDMTEGSTRVRGSTFSQALQFVDSSRDACCPRML